MKNYRISNNRNRQCSQFCLFIRYSTIKYNTIHLICKFYRCNYWSSFLCFVEAVEKAVSKIPTIPSNMRMHQAVTPSRGELTYRTSADCAWWHKIWTVSALIQTISCSVTSWWLPQPQMFRGKADKLLTNGVCWRTTMTCILASSQIQVKHMLTSAWCRRLGSTGFSGQPANTSSWVPHARTFFKNF